MSTASATRSRARRRTSPPVVGLGVLLALLMLAPSIAMASVLIQNRMSSGVTATAAGPEFYAYEQGAEAVFDLAADWALGTFDGTEVTASGSALRLASAAGGTWWNTAWAARRCFTVDNIGPALLEHQVRLEFDSTQDLIDGLVQAAGSDYRALASDHSTELDLFVESGVGTASTVVWVQLDLAAFTTTELCLYYGNPVAPSVSSQVDVFTYTTMRELYFPAYWRFDGSTGDTGTLDLVSYVDNNSISVGGATTILNAGDTASFTNITPDTQILSTGPLGGKGRDNGFDALVPISFGGTSMVFATDRSTNRWTIVSPTDANATVEIFDGTTLAWSGNVGTSAVTPTVDISTNNAGVIRSTNGVPIIVTHTATKNSFSDAQTVPPAFGDDLYGVRSRAVRVGFAAGGTADLLMSDGSTMVATAAAGQVFAQQNNSDTHGDGTAIRVTNFAAGVAAMQQADANGNESTAFLPERLLESEYRLPTRSRYIAFSCPTAMTILVGGINLPCGPPLPGHPGHAVAGDYPAGTLITNDTGAPFYAYYEDRATKDEVNLFGMKSAWAFSQYELPITVGATELQAGAATLGTWTSPVIDTATGGSNVFGLLSALSTIPAGTDVRMQIARGSTAALAMVAPFVGPDGTAATWFAPAQAPIPYAWDHGDSFYIVRIELSSTTAGTTPEVEGLRLGYDLPTVGLLSAYNLAGGAGGSERTWLVRVWAQDPILSGANAALHHRGATGLTGASDMAAALDAEQQVVIAAGSVTQPTGLPVLIGPSLAHSIVIDAANMTGATVDMTWSASLAGSSIIVSHDLTLTFT